MDSSSTNTNISADYNKSCARKQREGKSLVEFMRNLICQHHWNRDFDWDQDRWHSHGDYFGYENRNCYFLIDHGDESTVHPPVVWYKWTGDSLLGKPVIRRPNNSSSAERPAYCHIIQSRLRRDMSILDQDIDF